MQLPRFQHDAAASVRFCEEALAALGAVTERTWHDRLEVVAEGPAAQIWKENGSWHETSLRFLGAEATDERDAATDVFPGCPLTFRMAERLASPSLLQSAVIKPEATAARLPPIEALERLWREQHGPARRWSMGAPRSDWHFSLVGLVRCEIQAIEQHWSLHRLAVSLPDGEPDERLASALPMADIDEMPAPIEWPALDLPAAVSWLAAALQTDLAPALHAIRARQETHLRRELARINDYFDDYQRELAQRRPRTADGAARLEQRLAAAMAERDRRRHDQVARHAVHVMPRLDAALLVAEPAWRAEIHIEKDRRDARQEATFVPRSRRWHLARS